MESVNKILKSKKCFGCGLCKRLCPENAISLNANEKSGFWEISVNQNACVNCGLCLKNCPANEDRLPKADTVGAHDEIVLCHSANNEVRYSATSGGAVNSIIRYLIESKTADSVITVKENIDAPFDTEIVKIDKSNLDLLLESPRSFASRYVSLPVLSELPEKGENTAVVGTPCQIKALSEYDKENCFIKIGIVCSAATSYNASRLIKNKLADSSYHIYYRGNGWPGFNTLTNGENTYETPHGKSYFEKMYSSQLFKRYSCRFCPSHFAEEADLSFFDFWNKEEIKSEKTGNSACIIRSDRGRKIYNGAAEGGYVQTVKSIAENDALNAQGVALKYKTKRPYGSIYFKITDFLFNSGLYKLIPISFYKYLCRFLAKTVK